MDAAWCDEAAIKHLYIHTKKRRAERGQLSISERTYGHKEDSVLKVLINKLNFQSLRLRQYCSDRHLVFVRVVQYDYVQLVKPGRNDFNEIVYPPPLHAA